MQVQITATKHSLFNTMVNQFLQDPHHATCQKMAFFMLELCSALPGHHLWYPISVPGSLALLQFEHTTEFQYEIDL
jgi:hypothetical protein